MAPELTRVEQWEKTSEVPLLLLAAAFLVACAWPILDPNLDPDLETFFFYASWTVWVAFTIDFLIRLRRSAVDGLTGRVAVYVAGAAIFAVSLSALAILDVERDAPDANITTPGDALWWASTTVTTVGYGDHFPVTTQGRFIAVGLMLVGISLVGSLTAVIASWMIKNVEKPYGRDESPRLED